MGGEIDPIQDFDGHDFEIWGQFRKGIREGNSLGFAFGIFWPPWHKIRKTGLSGELNARPGVFWILLHTEAWISKFKIPIAFSLNAKTNHAQDSRNSGFFVAEIGYLKVHFNRRPRFKPTWIPWARVLVTGLYIIKYWMKSIEILQAFSLAYKLPANAF